MKNRRDLLRNVFGASISIVAGPALLNAQQRHTQTSAATHAGFNLPVQTRDVADLPFTILCVPGKADAADHSNHQHN